MCSQSYKKNLNHQISVIAVPIKQAKIQLRNEKQKPISIVFKK